MGRIEQIKERHTPGKVIEYQNPWDLVNLYKSDAEYLLSRIQIAEEVLTKYANDEYLQSIGYADDAEKALEQIGE